MKEINAVALSSAPHAAAYACKRYSGNVPFWRVCTRGTMDETTQSSYRSGSCIWSVYTFQSGYILLRSLLIVINVEAGMIAGTCQAVVAAPIDTLKHRFHVADLVEGRYHSITDYVMKTAILDARNFFGTTYRHIGTTILRDGAGYALFFGSFTAVRQAVRRELDRRVDADGVPLVQGAHHRNVLATVCQNFTR
jgi:hypothetical protein